MFQGLLSSALVVFASLCANAGEVLDRNSFQAESLVLSLGATAGKESKIELPFMVHEDLEVEVTGVESLKDVSVSAKIVERGYQSEDNLEPVRYLQVVAKADYSAAVATDVPVSLRLIGKESGIVHYLQSVKVTVEPKLTIRLYLKKDGSVEWSTPEEIRLRAQNQPILVSYVIAKNDSGEPARIHNQGGPIAHSPIGVFYAEPGDKYEVVVDSREPSKNLYWEHMRESMSDQRVIWFNAITE